jgi:hypothetical protein
MGQSMRKAETLTIFGPRALSGHGEASPQGLRSAKAAVSSRSSPAATKQVAALELDAVPAIRALRVSAC